MLLGESKGEMFAAIVTAVNITHERDYAPAQQDADALEEIGNHIQWIETNIEEGDGDAVKLENLACAIAAANRYAALLLARLSDEQVAAVLAEVQP